MADYPWQDSTAFPFSEGLACCCEEEDDCPGCYYIGSFADEEELEEYTDTNVRDNTIVADPGPAEVVDFSGTGGSSVAASAETSNVSSRPRMQFQFQANLTAGALNVAFIVTATNVSAEEVNQAAIVVRLHPCNSGGIVDEYDDITGESAVGVPAVLNDSTSLTVPSDGEYRVSIEGLGKDGVVFNSKVRLEITVTNSGLETLDICYDIEP